MAKVDSVEQSQQSKYALKLQARLKGELAKGEKWVEGTPQFADDPDSFHGVRPAFRRVLRR